MKAPEPAQSSEQLRELQRENRRLRDENERLRKEKERLESENQRLEKELEAARRGRQTSGRSVFQGQAQIPSQTPRAKARPRLWAACLSPYPATRR